MTSADGRNNPRHIRARRGSEIKAKAWTTEAAVRMLMNNLDDEVAEDPQSLVVYGGIGPAAPQSGCFCPHVATPQRPQEDHNPPLPSGTAGGGVRPPQEAAPRV